MEFYDVLTSDYDKFYTVSGVPIYKKTDRYILSRFYDKSQALQSLELYKTDYPTLNIWIEKVKPLLVAKE